MLFTKQRPTVVVDNPVERAAMTATPAPDVDSPTLDRQIAAAERQRNNLLAVEDEARRKIDIRLQELKAQKQHLLHPYPRLSLEPLSWRGKDGLPVLAVFTPDSDTAHIRISRDAWHVHEEWSPELPARFRVHYEDLLKNVRQRQREVYNDWSITAQFTGVLPDATRERIRAAMAEFPWRWERDGGERNVAQGVFLIAEAQWKKREVKAPRLDPLVVAWDGQNLYLIDHFDLTPVEKLVVEEFPALD